MTTHELSLLRDIRDAGEEILARVRQRTFDSYASDRELQLIAERLFIILGEAATRVQQQYPRTATRVAALRGAIAFRNFLIHVYDRIDPKKVWDIIQTDLAPLVEQVQCLVSADEGNTQI